MSLRVTKPQNEQTFYGHGKLLLTGEYFVLDGALALAVPTKLGQLLRVKELLAADGLLYWIALDNNGKAWLQLTFNKTDLRCLDADTKEANDLSKILLAARALNPGFLSGAQNIAIETRLEFARNWGLGSSSTLIYCLSQWAGVDGYTLLQNSIGGSGYDVACAGYDTAITYRLLNNTPETTAVDWKPAFADKIYFAHLGQKQSSPEGIKNYRQLLQDKSAGVRELTRITEAVLNCPDFKKFEALVEEHEELVSQQLQQQKVKDKLFADYWGTVKSLGAWGGDFVMLTNDKGSEELKAYLKLKNIETVFTWNEMIVG